MSYIRILLVLALAASVAFAREKVELNLTNVTIEEFLKVVSKIYNKNILLTEKINGNIDFLGTAPIYKDELDDVLLTVLEARGYTLVQSGSFLKVVRASVAARENLPIVKSLSGQKLMVTKAIKLEDQNIEIVIQKIRHLLSPSARVATMRETNTLLLTEYPQNIQTAVEAIEILSRDTKKDVAFIEIKNANIEGVYAQVLGIVKAKDNQAVLTNQYTILKNSGSNSLIVVGTQAQIAFVRRIARELDVKEDLGTPQAEIVRLIHTDAASVAKTVSDLMAKALANAKIKPIVSSDEEMNALIVIAMLDDVKKIKELVKDLDVPRQQVYVKATIVELNNDDALKMGVDYGVSIAGGDAGAGIYGIGLSLAKKGTARSDQMLLKALNNGHETAFALDVGLQFLSSKGVAQTLSEPSIICVNNKQSDIYVGKTISFQTASNTQTTGGTVNSYSRQDVGLTLTVKPRISSRDLVALEVSAQLENVAGTGTDGQPITTKSKVKTNAIVKNGEPVILGGLVREDESQAKEGIPYLSDIPFLGRFFRFGSNSKLKQNLLVIVTPYIISKEQDLLDLRKRLLEKEELKSKVLQQIFEGQ
ncbi:MAG: secretin N-terminal domain-containing protein [Helicobacteraceae bacterium]